MVLSLIGYRGSGKSTVARLLAATWGWRWRDADEAVESLAGKSIARIFAEQGEECFRELEARVLRELVGEDRLVLAAGGGAVLRRENRALLRTAGKVVWLRADAATLLLRVRADTATASRRPPLTQLGAEEEVAALLAEREPLYRECADVVVETADKTPQQVAAEVAQSLAPWPTKSAADFVGAP